MPPDDPEPQYVYRGVPPTHHRYPEALQGIAMPGDPQGHEDARRHNYGATQGSRFTSWTRTRKVAVDHAMPEGVVLQYPLMAPPPGAGWRFELSPDVYFEDEVLVLGVLTGAKVTTP